jgi:hypothetical protein
MLAWKSSSNPSLLTSRPSALLLIAPHLLSFLSFCRKQKETMKSFYFSFDDKKTRDSIMQLVDQQKSYTPVKELRSRSVLLLCSTARPFVLLICFSASFSFSSLEHMTEEWTKGNVSNYDYLLFLNLQAGRSFNDITQV